MQSKLLGIFLLAALLFSCGEEPMYEKVYNFKNRSWDQSVKPEFEVDIQNTDVTYDFTLSLRTTTDYPYSNLWIFMKSVAPDGSTGREPYEIHIANPDGSWIGNKTGSIVETELSFSSRKLPQKGKYVFTVEQGITESQVTEVLDIGFRVSPSKGAQK